MPFGKYQGRELDDVPQDYLLWVLENCKKINPYLRRAILDELGIEESRPASGPQPPDGAGGSPGGKELADIVRGWFRQLCLDYHPDRGGSHEAMVAINEAHGRLRQALGID
jgi:hypothetical protein